MKKVYKTNDTSYNSMMNEKIRQYNNLMRKAEVIARDNGGVPTNEEGDMYLQASKVCQEIINLNISQRSIHTQWEMRKSDCEDEVKRIVNYLRPPVPVKPAEPVQEEQSAEPDTQKVSAKPAPAARPKQEVAKETASGFKTKNACKDVPADTIEKWFKDKPSHNFSDVSGMEELKETLKTHAADLEWEKINEALNISPVQSFFFYGPPGTGKTFVIEAFASELMEKGYKFIRLLGGDIHASLVGVAEKTVEIAFKEAIDNEPCIIFIDEIENVCVSRSNPGVEAHEKRLTVAFLEAYNLLRESKKHVVFMGATNYPGHVDEAMLDRITLIRIPLPPVESRESYFNRQFKNIRVEDGFSYADMAEATDNYSFRDLDRLVQNIRVELKNIAIRISRVELSDGSVDHQETDEAAAQAVGNQDIMITRELFENVQKELPPSDKVRILEELEQFEARVKAINS